MMSRIRRAYSGSDSTLSRTVCSELERRGLEGKVAACLFRAQKASKRAKRYGPTKYQGMAYGRKEDMLERLCQLLGGTELVWGWSSDGRNAVAPNVLYVELPGLGQVSFHCKRRFDGPDYLGNWDGMLVSEARILQYCEMILHETPLFC